MNCKGFTLIEALMAVAILGIALVGVLPSFITLLDANTLSEERSDAVAVAQLVREDLRRTEPSTLPSSGVSAVQLITVGDKEFEALTRYCVRSEYCGSASRHIVVEIAYAGTTVYQIETVYTKLQ